MMRLIALPYFAVVLWCTATPVITTQELLTSEPLSHAITLHDTADYYSRHRRSKPRGRYYEPYSLHALAERSQLAACAMWIGIRSPLLIQFSWKEVLLMLFQIRFTGHQHNKISECSTASHITTGRLLHVLLSCFIVRVVYHLCVSSCDVG